jgi:hypothetical protein
MDLPDGVADHLDGLEEWVQFDTTRDMAKAVGYLVGCHQHRLIVLPHGKPSLVMTSLGFDCLKKHFRDRKISLIQE